MLSIKVDASELIEGMRVIPKVLMDSIRTEMKQQVTNVQKYARQHHRFKTHSAMLERSIETQVLSGGVLGAEGLVGEVYLDDGIADYGVYVHEGHAAPYDAGGPLVWEPDKFLDEALEHQEPQIQEAMTQAVEHGLRMAGL
jgi:hypothetical protein